uniref:TGB1 n=1 Tax=Grapevine virus T TaxID=2016035 RepID=A0A3G3LPZ8_9VIRU|nr:triple gene block 1 protein [Grapevine virus T]QCG75795.1 TGB1 [Grapevine virus T]QCG75800.1 TGB1 [Grapevine virus T]
MNNLISALELFGFTKVSEEVSRPLVIHSVPGGGKTSLIRSLIKLDSDFEAFTAGVPDAPNLEGRYIKSYYAGCASTEKLSILDEYLTAENWEGFEALFSDPYQNCKSPLAASYVSKKTRRFGRSTCEYLISYGFEIESELEDSVVKGSPFEVKVEGQLICFGKAAVELASNHRVEFKLPCEVRGSTFDVVTLLKSEEPNSENKHLFYIGCTRHRKKLLILE